MAKIPYEELYTSLLEDRCYDLRFLDGAIVLMHYEFIAKGRGSLHRSSVAFLPAPDLTPFQDDPDLYLADELYGDIVDQRAVSVPIRFDFDSRPDVIVDLLHPVSHLTIGMYEHCRIPITGAASPYYVIEFLLRSFYRTTEHHWTDELPGPAAPPAASTISDLERSYLHLAVPTA